MKPHLEQAYALKGIVPFPVPEGARATRELLQYVPQLSAQERDRRWDLLRKKMVYASIDAMLFIGNDTTWDAGMANFRYIFQVGSKQGAWGLFPLEEVSRRCGMVHRRCPARSRSTLRGKSGVFELPTRYRGCHDRRGVCRARAEESKGRRGSLYLGRRQEQQFVVRSDDGYPCRAPGVPNSSDLTWVVQEMRLIKTEEEIGMLRAAGKIARMAVNTMIEFAKPGVTEAQLWAEMLKTQIVTGAEPDSFNLLSSGPVEHPPNEIWHLLHGTSQPMVPTLRAPRRG